MNSNANFQMRTINQVYSILIEEDPDTAVTKSGLRNLVKNGKIPSVKVGNKYLIDLQKVKHYFSSASA